MKIIRILSLSTLILMLPILSTKIYSQINTTSVNKSTTKTESVATKYGALAIDRSNGFYNGLAANYSTLSEAEKKAIEECNKKGGKCTVVLSYSGTGCVAYRCSGGKNVGIAFGWGLAKTKDEADAIAKKECFKRSYGMSSPNFVWSCNNANSGTLKEIYNASNEIISLPGEKTDY